MKKSKIAEIFEAEKISPGSRETMINEAHFLQIVGNRFLINSNQGLG